MPYFDSTNSEFWCLFYNTSKGSLSLLHKFIPYQGIEKLCLQAQWIKIIKVEVKMGEPTVMACTALYLPSIFTHGLAKSEKLLLQKNRDILPNRRTVIMVRKEWILTDFWNSLKLICRLLVLIVHFFSLLGRQWEAKPAVVRKGKCKHKPETKKLSRN